VSAAALPGKRTPRTAAELTGRAGVQSARSVGSSALHYSGRRASVTAPAGKLSPEGEALLPYVNHAANSVHC